MADALAIESRTATGPLLSSSVPACSDWNGLSGRRQRLDTTVLNNSSRLLSRQLDETGSALFKNR